MQMCRLFTQCVGFLAVAVSLQGCSGDEASPPQTSPRASTDQHGGSATWTSQPQMTDGEERMLVNYFRRQPSVADNPLINGEPEIYSNASGGTRFYWLSRADTEVRWVFLEFQHGRFATMQSGTGELFPPKVNENRRD